MDEVVSFRLDKGVLAKARRWASERGWSLSELIRTSLYLAGDIFEEDSWASETVHFNHERNVWTLGNIEVYGRDLVSVTASVVADETDAR